MPDWPRLDRHAGAVQDREHEVRDGRVIGVTHVRTPVQRTGAAANHGIRDVEMAVLIAVAHVAAEEQDRVVEHRAIAVGHLGKLADELREHARVVGLHAREAVELCGVPLVMRERVERVGHADVVERHVADFGFHHEAHDARHVGLER